MQKEIGLLTTVNFSKLHVVMFSTKYDMDGRVVVKSALENCTVKI